MDENIDRDMTQAKMENFVKISWEASPKCGVCYLELSELNYDHQLFHKRNGHHSPHCNMLSSSTSASRRSCDCPMAYID